MSKLYKFRTVILTVIGVSVLAGLMAGCQGEGGPPLNPHNGNTGATGATGNNAFRAAK